MPNWNGELRKIDSLKKRIIDVLTEPAKREEFFDEVFNHPASRLSAKTSDHFVGAHVLSWLCTLAVM